MSYQLSIILGTTISLRKFRRALFGPISVRSPFCFPRDGDLSLTSKGKARMATAGGEEEEEEEPAGERKREQGGRSECVRIAPSIIFTREGARRREGGGGGGRLLFVRISFPECQWVTCIDEDDSLEGARGEKNTVLSKKGTRGSSEGGGGGKGGEVVSSLLL